MKSMFRATTGTAGGKGGCGGCLVYLAPVDGSV